MPTKTQEAQSAALSDPLMDRPAAAKLLGVSVVTLDAAISQSLVPVVRFGRRVRIRLSAVEAVIEKGGFTVKWPKSSTAGRTRGSRRRAG